MGNESLKLLLDTHVWIWAFEGNDSLGVRCGRFLRDKSSERWVSPVSTLEIARLVERGHLELACPISEWVARSMVALQMRTIFIDHAIAMEAYGLSRGFHGDPADRMLVATARLHDCHLVTADRRILACQEVRSLSAEK